MPQNLALNGIGLQTASVKEVNIAAKEPATKREAFKDVLNNNTQADKYNDRRRADKNQSDHKIESAQEKKSQSTAHNNKASDSGNRVDSLDEAHPTNAIFNTDGQALAESVELVNEGVPFVDSNLTTHALPMGHGLLDEAVLEDKVLIGNNLTDEPITVLTNGTITGNNAISTVSPLTTSTMGDNALGLSEQALRAGGQPLTSTLDKNALFNDGSGRHRMSGVSNLTGEQPSIITQDAPTINQAKASNAVQPASFFDMLQNNTQKNQAFSLKDSLLTPSVDAGGAELTSSTNSYTNMLSKTDGVNMLATAEAKPSFPVNVQFGNAAWSGAIAKQTANLLMQNIQSAELRLNPDDLGPINVKVNVNQDQASVMFQTNNPAVREALEQSVLRLRDMLSQEGLNLLESHVGDNPEFTGQQQGEQGEGHAQAGNQDGSMLPDDASLATEQTVQVQYGVDSYA